MTSYAMNILKHATERNLTCCRSACLRYYIVLFVFQLSFTIPYRSFCLDNILIYLITNHYSSVFCVSPVIFHQDLVIYQFMCFKFIFTYYFVIVTNIFTGYVSIISNSLSVLLVCSFSSYSPLLLFLCFLYVES